MELLVALCVLLAALLLEVVLYAWTAVVYILEGKSMYAIAKRRGLPNPWMAWVPFAKCWLLGSIADQYRQLVKGQTCNRRKTLLTMKIIVQAVTTAAGVIGGMVAGIGMVARFERTGGSAAEMLAIFLIAVGVALIPVLAVAILYDVFAYIACYDVFASCKPDKAVGYLLLSIFLPVMPFLVYACRNDDAGMIPQSQE